MQPTQAVVLIASPLEEEHVARLRALAPERLLVLHDPHLLPTPRFPADHRGAAFQRTPKQQGRWQGMLLAALRSGQVAFAALDVTDPEPLPAESPLWDMKNVFISPHSASTVSRENARITELFCYNLGCWLDGRRAEMRNVLDTNLMY
jgi:hypothetical protein